MLSCMRQLGSRHHFTVTATSRAPREAETDGVDYIFLSEDQFRQMIAQNNFLEWAEVHGNYYGVPKSQVVEALSQGKNVILKIDVQGAATVRKLAPEALLIFVEAPSFEVLVDRLTRRSTENDEQLKRRISNAKQEIAQKPLYDYVVVNPTDEAHKAAADIERIIGNECSRIPSRKMPDFG